MQDHKNADTIERTPWKKGKLIGAKPPLRPKHVWVIRAKLQIEGRIRDLAMFNLAIDSKPRSLAGHFQDSPPAAAIPASRATASSIV